MQVNPYLNFDGNAEQAFEHYRSVFGGEFIAKLPMSEAPDSDKLPLEEQKRMMHISLAISEDTILMASDIMPSMGHKLPEGSNCYISLHPTSREEADRLFNGLSEGGYIEMPMEDQFWGDYFGSFTDRFDVKWMINYNEQNK